MQDSCFFLIIGLAASGKDTNHTADDAGGRNNDPRMECKNRVATSFTIIFQTAVNIFWLLIGWD